MILFAGMLTALLLFLMDPRTGHWYLLLVAAAAGAAFAIRELRVPEPFLDLRVLGGNPPLLATYGRNLLTYTVSYAFIYGYTQWLEGGRGLSPSQAGILLLPSFLGGIVVAAVTGRRSAVRGKLLAGAICQIVACAMLLLLGSQSPVWLLVLIPVIIGIPQGLNGLANQNAVYYQADPSRIGASAGLLRTFMYLGAMIAAAATGLLFGPGIGATGLHDLAYFMLVAAALFLIASATDRSLRRIGSKTQEYAPA
jgi:hypothetical protein